MCMYDVRLGVSEGMFPSLPPRNLDVLRLLQRPFCDRSRAVVAIWLVECCIKFSLSLAFAKPVDIEY